MKKVFLFIPMVLYFITAFTQNAVLPDTAYKCISISADDFYAMIKSGKDIKIIDVRLPAEFRPERIENAVNIPVLKISAKKTRKLNKESVFVLYCVGGTRSCKAALKMHDLGFKNLYSLDGGIRAWKKKGLPVVSRKHKKYSVE